MTLRYFQNIGPHMHYKAILSLFVVFSITCIFNMFSPIYAQQQQQGVNWLEICKNPLVDAFITEPCETLTSPDGYTLTPLGERVLGCISGGTLAVLIAQPELLALRNAVGCGPNSGDSSLSDNTQSTHSGSSSIGSSIITSQSNPNEDSGSSCSTIQECSNPKYHPFSSNSYSTPQSNPNEDSGSSCSTIQECSNPKYHPFSSNSYSTPQSNPNEDSGSSSCTTITQDCPNNISNSSPSSESNQSNNKTLVCTLTQFCSNPTELQSSISSTNNNISNTTSGYNQTSGIPANTTDLKQNTDIQSHTGTTDQF
jgi:hypothetical protein